MIDIASLQALSNEEHRKLGRLYASLGPRAGAYFIAGLIEGGKGVDGKLHPDPYVAKVYHQLVADVLNSEPVVQGQQMIG